VKITLGHSPDSDDAFMFYALARHLVDEEGYEFEHILRDIETLNRWALEGKLHVTAISVHGYAYVADQYAILPHGASMGDNYGPMVVAREPLSRQALKEVRIAIPGTLTSAFLALRLWLGEFAYEVVPFDQIMERVHGGDFAAGLLIHEGQLTHGELGLQTLVDLGVWWHGETGLPLPLGVNVIRKDLGEARLRQLSRILHRSIDYGLRHREEGLDYALSFARGMERSLADQFVGMYVNDWTLDMGEAGRRSIRLFLQRGHEAGVISHLPPVEFVTDEEG
jgi:1,4-dihydroxy-6-naphthoate synthase